jgi:hypothetical protein
MPRSYVMPEELPSARWVMMTPDWATRLLNAMPINRRLAKHRSEAIARDIVAGEWRLTHEAVAVDGNGDLVDGQHRLWAVVLSDIAVPLLFVSGISASDAGQVVDTGKPRSTPDSAAFKGMSWVDGKVAATARLMLQGVDKAPHNSPSRIEELGFIDEHADALRFVADHFRSHLAGINMAGVRAAVGCAYYHVDRERLSEFVRVLYNGFSSNGRGDKGALVLVRWLMRRQEDGATGGGHAAQIEVFLKSQRAIKAFVEHEDIGRLVAPAGEIYAVPRHRED